MSHNKKIAVQRRLWTYDDFKKYTLPKLQLKKVIRIQALIRGAYVRKKRMPHIINFSIAADKVAENFIEAFIEDIFIPDMVLDLLSRNQVYENFSLYSDENRVFYEVRESIVVKVVRQMLHESLKEMVDRLVGGYLKKRFTEKPIEQKDPMWMATNSILDSTIKQIIEFTAKSSIREITLDYLIESQFIVLFGHHLLPKAVNDVVADSIEDVIVMDVLEQYFDRIVKEGLPIVISREIEREKKRVEGIELEKAFGYFTERCVMETCLDNLSRIYEEEEKVKHQTEALAKKLKDDENAKVEKLRKENYMKRKALDL